MSRALVIGSRRNNGPFFSLVELGLEPKTQKTRLSFSVFGSGPFMISRLANTPNVICCLDEGSILWLTKAPTDQKALETAFLTLFEGNSHSTGSFKNKNFVATNVHLSLSACFTLDSFTESYQGRGSGGSGYLSRVALAFGTRIPTAGQAWPDYQATKAKSIATEIAGRLVQPKPLSVNPEAAKLITDFKKWLEKADQHFVIGGPYWEGDPNDARDHMYETRIDSNYVHRSRIVTSIVDNLHDVLFTEDNIRKLLKALDKQATDKQIDERMVEISTVIVSHSRAAGLVHSSELKEITEYGRAVHAEMDALLTCARLGIGVKGKRLFTTTFPCHNCTRHIIAAGISSVTYIEPYPKSRAADLHKDAICFNAEDVKERSRIPFVPFVGVGPRRYLDLFSLDLSTGRKVERRDPNGKAVFPERSNRPPRVPMIPYSYLERENKLLEEYEDVLIRLQGKNNGQGKN